MINISFRLYLLRWLWFSSLVRPVNAPLIPLSLQVLGLFSPLLSLFISLYLCRGQISIHQPAEAPPQSRASHQKPSFRSARTHKHNSAHIYLSDAVATYSYVLLFYDLGFTLRELDLHSKRMQGGLVGTLVQMKKQVCGSAEICFFYVVFCSFFHFCTCLFLSSVSQWRAGSQGTKWTSLQLIPGPHRVKPLFTLTFMPMDSLASPVDLTCMLFSACRRKSETTRKDPGPETNPQPSCCKATAHSFWYFFFLNWCTSSNSPWKKSQKLLVLAKDAKEGVHAAIRDSDVPQWSVCGVDWNEQSS